MNTTQSLNPAGQLTAKFCTTSQCGTEESTTNKLPPLRGDIELIDAEYDSNGIPSWTLHDPLRGRFFRLGWLEFEMLSRWSISKAASIAQQINRETTLNITENDVETFRSFLLENELLDIHSRSDIDKLLQTDQRRKKTIWSKMFSFTMYQRIPLVNPDKFLGVTYALFKPLFSTPKLVFSVFILAASIALAGISAHWYEFRDTFMLTMNPTGFMGYLAALIGINILHESGHGLFAKHYKCRVPVMGVALIFLLPVCYSDVSDAWKLRSKKQRLLIDAGGILMELALAVFAILLWLSLPDGIGRMLAFFVAVTSLVTTLFVNLNPFMKFDGYFLLSDLFATDNLQSRAFANFKWELRKYLVGAVEPMPYPVTCKTLSFHRLYAVSTSVYRIFLYMGIAYMVYTYWFKLMGIILVAGLAFTLVAKPIIKESMGYLGIIKKNGLNRRSLSTLTLFSFMLILFIFPLPRKVSAPALLTAQQASRVYSPDSAELTQIHVQSGQSVSQGDLLFTLSDSFLDYEEKRLKEELALLQRRVQTETGWITSSAVQQIQRENIDSKLAELTQIQNRKRDFNLTSPVNGEIVMLSRGIKAGNTVAANTVLAEIASTRQSEIRAYISASDKEHISGHSARFINNNDSSSVPATVQSISTNAISELEDESLALVNGGPIPVVNIETAIKPKNDLYLAILDPSETNTFVLHEQSGVVMFAAKPRSLASSTFNRLYGVVLRESGF